MAARNKMDGADKPIGARFDVLERVGDGPLFEVFKARERQTERVCAVKRVNLAFAGDEAFVHALQQTIPQVADLSHPNIARTYELDRSEAAPAIVQEFVRGINLKERIRRIAPFTLSVAVDFLIGAAEGLQYAHARGILHGDLRPHNIIVSPEGVVKLTDFGVAEAISASPKATAANLDRAVHYQAPEISAGGRAAAESDIYSLGAILYEMLTGVPPYEGDTPGVVADKHRAAPIPSPHDMNPGVPKSVEGIVIKSLQKSPGDRYRSVSDLLSDLKSVRDALRFGKPLSWSPADTAGASTGTAPTDGALKSRTERIAPPVPQSMDSADGGNYRMPTAAATDDRISPWLKLALGSVVFVLVTACIVGAALWMAVFTKPPDIKFPELIGMKIDDARAVATRSGVRFIEHEEFNDKYEPSVIYRTDLVPGRQVRQGRIINVWVSKGSRMVWVPNVTKIGAQEAESKLKAAGLTLGQVDRQNDETIPFGNVVAQNPRAGKRVNRDTSVNLMVSDGPKPQEDQSQPDNSTNGTGGIGGGAVTPSQPAQDQNNTDATDQTSRRYDLKVKVNADGRGKRRVRVEYDDVHGTHPVVDEEDDEGAVIEQRVEVFGPKLTIRVYYGDDTTPVLEKTRYLTSRDR